MLTRVILYVDDMETIRYISDKKYSPSPSVVMSKIRLMAAGVGVSPTLVEMGETSPLISARTKRVKREKKTHPKLKKKHQRSKITTSLKLYSYSRGIGD